MVPVADRTQRIRTGDQLVSAWCQERTSEEHLEKVRFAPTPDTARLRGRSRKQSFSTMHLRGMKAAKEPNLPAATLRVVQPAVEPARGDQLQMAALFSNSGLADHHDAIGAADRRQPMRDDQRGAALR